MAKDNVFYPSISVRMGEGMRILDQPLIMGILNCTPDSFFAESRATTIDNLLIKAKEMILDGAEVLDLGAYSTRPGARIVNTEEEITRLIPAVEAVRKHFPEITISADTFRADVAEKALDAGANWVNDIGGGTLDDKMFGLIAAKNCPYVLMHIQGRPENMQEHTRYGHLLNDIIRDLSGKVYTLRQKGVNDIIVDPGIGFGKTLEDNYRLLQSLEAFQLLKAPLLTGISRKSFIYKKLGITPESALNATSALHLQCLLQGTKILRVHDVKAAKEIIQLYLLLQENQDKA